MTIEEQIKEAARVLQKYLKHAESGSSLERDIIASHIRSFVSVLKEEGVKEDLAKPETLRTSELQADQGQVEFISAFNQLADEVHQNAKAHGFWETDRNDGEMICLMHSELSEAHEAIRHGNPPDDKVPEFLGTEAELADVIIRIMDMAHARKWRVAEALIAKMEMNKSRPYKHGKLC